MATRREVTGQLEYVTRNGRSGSNGNPRWNITIGGDDAGTYTTGIDASVGYEVSNHRVGRIVTLTLEGKSDKVVRMVGIE